MNRVTNSKVSRLLGSIVVCSFVITSPLHLWGQGDLSVEAVGLTSAVMKSQQTGDPILVYIFDST